MTMIPDPFVEMLNNHPQLSIIIEADEYKKDDPERNVLIGVAMTENLQKNPELATITDGELIDLFVTNLGRVMLTGSLPALQALANKKHIKDLRKVDYTLNMAKDREIVADYSAKIVKKYFKNDTEGVKELVLLPTPHSLPLLIITKEKMKVYIKTEKVGDDHQVTVMYDRPEKFIIIPIGALTREKAEKEMEKENEAKRV